MATDLTPVISAETLHKQLANPDLLIVDVSSAEDYEAAHVPGAVHIDYADFVTAEPPVMGLVPDAASLSQAFSAMGLSEGLHVVAYDREGGGKAGRLLFTLDAAGHSAGSLLDGGLGAWMNAGFEISSGGAQSTPTGYQTPRPGNNLADKAYIQSRLGAPDLALLDCRTPAEYNGTDVRAQRGGHIPGAVNFNWTDAMDPDNPPSLRPEAELRGMLEAIGVTPDKEVIAYCQTHHRSSHTYMVLKQLGYKNVKGYPGAWSDWGNDPDMPVES